MWKIRIRVSTDGHLGFWFDKWFNTFALPKQNPECLTRYSGGSQARPPGVLEVVGNTKRVVLNVDV